MRTMRFPKYWREAETVGARRNRFQPSTGISKTLRIASRTMPKMLCPKYWRDSESINGMGNRFPSSTGSSWTHRKSAFPKYTGSNYERSRRTTDPGMRGGRFRDAGLKIGFKDQACRNAVSNFPALTINVARRSNSRYKQKHNTKHQRHRNFSDAEFVCFFWC